MALSDPGTHSFVVKIWLEESEQEAGQALWRGHVTHVPSGRRRYVQDLCEIVTFIQPYLTQMGIRQNQRRSVFDWIQRLIRSG